MCAIWIYLIKDDDNIDGKDLNDIYKKFQSLSGRGPDNYNFSVIDNKIIIGFHRLSIMDVSKKGNQPFRYLNDETEYICICNGEIYNADKIKKELKYDFTSFSDCEVLIPLYLKYGKNMYKYLDGVFSFVIVELKNNYYNVLACRDRIGVRPAFIGYNNNNGSLAISSEVKGLLNLFDNIEVFPPGKYLNFSSTCDTTFTYETYYEFKYKYNKLPFSSNILLDIKNKFTDAVRKRLITDRPLCALLSGGLDSSLVCSIASRLLKECGQKLYTFSIGMPGSPDNMYAKKVADFIGSVHTVVNINNAEALSAIKDVVWATETFDITTIRASTGQYLISKYISENTNFKVVLSGDGSDELTSGYLYNYNCPNHDDLHNEAVKRIKEIHLYDSLRADRATCIHGLELRVPFLDYKFIDYYLSINPELRQPTSDCMEKYLLRKSFEGYLPNEVLWRQKEAFSDGISSQEDSWYKTIQNHVENRFSEKDLLEAKINFSHCSPTTKESLYFRNMFNKLFGNKYSNVIPNMWMPMWSNTDDPSARTIKNIYKNNI